MSEIVTIVGGGLAGLTLGIGLRQRGVPITVWEARRYPRHRVCGEFISGGGQSSLARLGLLGGREVNICGLFRSEATVPGLAQRWRDWLGGVVATGVVPAARALGPAVPGRALGVDLARDFRADAVTAARAFDWRRHPPS
jgi:hypothetical protein